jgi:membrane-associated phospholipid phosphatase
MMLLKLMLRICGHTAAVGGLVGLILALILQYETPAYGFLIVCFLIAGLVGTSRLILGVQRPVEVYTGFMLGVGVVLITLLVY